MKAISALIHSRCGGWLLRIAFSHLHALLPIKRLIETDNLIAFHHPLPAYPIHMLIVPKLPLRSIGDLDDRELESLAIAACQAARQLQQSFNLGPGCLILNGGKFQDTAQLHFHLIGTNPTIGRR